MKKGELTLKYIFKFWFPIALTWLMMSFEGPYTTAVIARLSDAKYNLAAYGIAFSFALIVEAPIIMLMTASTALVKNRQSYKKLRNFTFLLNFLITLIMGIVLIPKVFNFITITLMGLEKRLAILVYHATALLLPWPAAIGFRRFYQGILIANNKTKRIAYGTVIRILTVIISTLLLANFTNFKGVYVGAISLSFAVIFEAFVIYAMTYEIIKDRVLKTESDFNLTYGYLATFYIPLALTSFIALGVQPIVTFFVAKSRLALDSLAVLPVVTSFIFIFRSMGLSFQEVGVALMKYDDENFNTLKTFVFMLSVIVSFTLAAIMLTPARYLWFQKVAGLSPDLIPLAVQTASILVLLPALSILISWQRSVLVNAALTRHITYGTIVEFVSIVVLMLVFLKMNLIGAHAAALSFILGRAAANIYFHQIYKKGIRNLVLLKD
ncbi:conserved hypothetical protein [Thermotomaculum hydrothermale]|uniref:Multi antimicrobial extrusion protein MatE n=1 Tax=Thermotomaculum hydrothermale TaxID=981385 RepID=A0A7R6PY69_9BACT|nr:MATE family efflux transporter [Thermotomaculum hydrothermale]BBB32990.1 conserved hypothetical protein [Thermotomaculum hydrothermale]